MSFSHSLKDRAAKVWEDGYRHPFLQELGRGTLDKEVFKFYLLQDYKYLLQYAKVFALGALKAESELLMIKFTAMQQSTLVEMDLHRSYMADFGVTPEQMQEVKPSLFNRAYTANMLATGQAGGLAEIIAAVFPAHGPMLIMVSGSRQSMQPTSMTTTTKAGLKPTPVMRFLILSHGFMMPLTNCAKQEPRGIT